nr:MAG TPA: hypothetical protein [Crassvirales sp.]
MGKSNLTLSFCLYYKYSIYNRKSNLFNKLQIYKTLSNFALFIKTKRGEVWKKNLA